MTNNDLALTLELSAPQAKSMFRALSFYEQLCRGNLLELSQLIKEGVIRPYARSNEPVPEVRAEIIRNEIEPNLMQCALLLGYEDSQTTTPLSSLKTGPEPALLDLLQAIHKYPNRTDNGDPYCIVTHTDAGGSRYELAMTLQQAQYAKDALDCYVRMALGQLTYVVEVALFGHLRVYAPAGQNPEVVQPDVAWGPLQSYLQLTKRALGFPPNGSYGIGNHNIHISANHCWDVNKVVARTLAMHRDPNPNFRSVDYDGIVVRYTSEPDPVATIVPAPAQVDREVQEQLGRRPKG